MSDETPKVIEDQPLAPQSDSEKEQDKATHELSDRKSDSELVMDVKVASPFKTYFESQAFSISAENETGPFDVLPHHHSFISLLKPCTIVIRTAKGVEQKIDISGGLMHVKADKVIVFLDV